MPLHIELPRHRRDDYAVQWTGYLRAPAGGIYRLATRSDDGSRVWIDDQLVVDNDGTHGAGNQVSGTIALAAGLHALRVEYFQVGGPASFEITCQGPGIDEGPIPPELLSHAVAAR